VQTIAVEDLATLRDTAREARRLIVKSVYRAGAGHLGGPLSAADLLTALYFKILRVDPERPDWADRDRFILSKGHSAIGLYSVLALRGYFPVEELDTFDEIDSRLQGHPDMTKCPGVDMASGSLGQGLSPGVGMAIGAKLAGKDFRTWVMLGDGEIQEGQIWEASMVAARYSLDNLVAILDYNGLQQYGWTNNRGEPKRTMRISVENPGKIWDAWGWRVLETDGHDIGAILETCREAMTTTGRPTVIIARTIKGKGVSYMENDYLWHSKPMVEGDLTTAMSDLAAPTGGR
jgi:transketolase